MTIATRRQRLHKAYKEALLHVTGHEEAVKPEQRGRAVDMTADIDIRPEDENACAELILALEGSTTEILGLDSTEEDALVHPLWDECCRKAEAVTRSFFVGIYEKICVTDSNVDKVALSQELELAFDLTSTFEHSLIKLLDFSKQTLQHHAHDPSADDSEIKPFNPHAIQHDAYVFGNLKYEYLILLGLGRSLEKLVMRFNFALEVPDWVHDPHKVAALGENRWEAPYDSSTFRIHAKPAPHVFVAHAPAEHVAEVGKELAHALHVEQ